MAPGYLSTLCQLVSSVPGRRHLRSAGRGELDYPRVNQATYGGRAFAYAGPTSWNSLPDSLKVKVKYRSGSYIVQLTRRTRTARFTISEVAVDLQEPVVLRRYPLQTFPGQSLSRTDVSRTSYTKEFSCT